MLAFKYLLAASIVILGGVAGTRFLTSPPLPAPPDLIGGACPRWPPHPYKGFPSIPGNYVVCAPSPAGGYLASMFIANDCEVDGNNVAYFAGPFPNLNVDPVKQPNPNGSCLMWLANYLTTHGGDRRCNHP